MRVGLPTQRGIGTDQDNSHQNGAGQYECHLAPAQLFAAPPYPRGVHHRWGPLRRVG
jgi:hypothetical protein